MKRLAGVMVAVAMIGPGTVAAQTPTAAKKPVATATAMKTAGAVPTAATASEFYMLYRAAFDKATRIEDVLPYMASSHKAEVEQTPADQRAKMFELIKMMNALTGVKVVKETPTATGATLNVQALDSEKKPTKGTVDMVKENGMWKVGKESWSS